MQKWRRSFLISLVLLLISQFFQYSTSWGWEWVFSLAKKERADTLVSSPESGWEKNSIFIFIIPILIYLFYKSERSMLLYLIATVCICVLGWGGDFGGFLGLLSILIAFYSLYVKSK